MPSIEVTTKPTLQPLLSLLLPRLRRQLRLQHTKMDDVLWELLEDAYYWSEDESGRRWLTQTLTVQFDADEARGPLWLPGSVIRSITSVTTYDQDDTATTVPSADYRLSGITAASAYVEGGRLDIVRGGGWDPGRDVYSVSVVYVAGYGTATDMPRLAHKAILRRAASEWRHPTDDITEMPKADASPVLTASQVLWPLRVNI